MITTCPSFLAVAMVFSQSVAMAADAAIAGAAKQREATVTIAAKATVIPVVLISK
jgi:hypothetical protein